MGAQDRAGDGRPGAGRGARIVLPFLVALSLLLAAAPAQASFHLIKVREVFPGTTARPDSDYVELQMYSLGQNLVHFGELEVLDPAGTKTDGYFPPGNVASGANQATVLIADSEFAAQFPGKSADFTDANLNLNPAGGAVCWPQTEPPFDDCASWGNFSAKASLPSPGDNAPAAASGIPNGMAILRSIAPGCATLLENADDADDSSLDFAVATPNPRNNATAPTEHECAAVPNTLIDTKPANPTKTTSASFTYHASPAAGATFECKLDLAAFASCPSSGIAYAGPLSDGSHSFEVRAVNEAGPDSTPATYTWAVDTIAPGATIQTHPEPVAPGNSAAFTYTADEIGSSFECSLEPDGEPAVFSSCPAAGKTYPDASHPGPLADGSWTFAVRAADKAGNQGEADTSTWAVDNQLGDTTPPQTTIESRPPDPSTSSSASFTYSSSEPESSFECALDGAGFSPCPAAGIAYTGLAGGAHAFQVRATDKSGNTDKSPAGYNFQVVLGGGSGGAGGQGPGSALSAPPVLPPSPAAKPNTTVSGKPGARTHDRTPTFRFGSGSPGARFECKLDGSPFRPCRSPLTTKALSFGPHTIRIRAAVAGVADPTPVVLAFRVVRK